MHDTGRDVRQVGFCLADKFGCSPDGLCENHGLEIKCHMPEKHLGYLLDQAAFVEEHKFQLHGSMVVTGMDRWDLYGYCRDFPPIHVQVTRDGFTADLDAGLRGMVAERNRVMAEIKALWEKWNNQ